MFCSPIQQADPFAYWSPSPSYGYSRQPSCCHHHHDPYTRAMVQEQARREAITQRRAYEAYMRKEAARRRAAEEEAAAAHHRQAVMDRILRAYAAQAAAQQMEEEEEDDGQVGQAPASIPISAFASETVAQDEIEQDDQYDVQSERDDSTESEELDQQNTPSSSQRIDEPARDSTADKPRISYQEAVAIVQKHAQVALLIRRRLASLRKVRDSFLAQQQSFRVPETLDFDTQKSQKSGQPVLLYTPNNRPLQAYEENLLRLLTDLDDIPSGGISRIKRVRKALARTIQSELDRIDAYKLQQWQLRR